MRDFVNGILKNWGIPNAYILREFDTEGAGVVCKVQTDNGVFILKGQPASSSQEFILGNIHAHEFLGNLHHIAPAIYYRPDGTAFGEMTITAII